MASQFGENGPQTLGTAYTPVSDHQQLAAKWLRCVADCEDRYHLKEDAGASNITNMPFIYNRLKPTFTCSLGTHANCRNPNNCTRCRLKVEVRYVAKEPT
ncbi:hypothetical protein AVEN_58357-1 [Araneus ventricosus]|uniref:Uncharacterized protein n=1 Tax=Araneus ventricosus TaxID=182803 RepID=A0A4Y2MP46_ARAVE|nr:hypothetical protein AVEN_58357-1 [Araneus ventricosus]